MNPDIAQGQVNKVGASQQSNCITDLIFLNWNHWSYFEEHKTGQHSGGTGSTVLKTKWYKIQINMR